MRKLNFNRKELPVGILIGIMVIYSIMPIVGRFFSDFFTTYAYMALLLVLTLLIMFEHGMKSFEYFILLILPLMLWKVLEYIGLYGVTLSASNAMLWGYSALLDFLPIFAAVYMFKSHERLIKPIAVITAVAALVTAISTTVGLYIYPDAARFLATEFETTNEFYITLEWMNMGGYDSVYTMVLLYPLVIYAFKQKKIHLVTAVVGTLILLVFILRSQYTIALLLFIVTTGLFFTKKDLTAKRVWIMLAAAVVLILAFWAVFSSLIEILAKNVESKEISDRLFALAGGVDGLSNSDDKRWELYMRSFATMFRYPIIGGYWFEGMTSGHSFILDVIANWGALGAIALFLIYRELYNMFYKPYRFERGFGYILWIFLQTIFLSVLNNGAWISVLALFVPVLLCFIDNKREIKSVRLKIEE